jgi:diguanylate cyclase (GGDEF)-like protein/PAS domain S-box-containing protein
MASTHFQEAFRRVLSESNRAESTSAGMQRHVLPILAGLGAGALFGISLSIPTSPGLFDALVLCLMLVLVHRFGALVLVGAVLGTAGALAAVPTGHGLLALWDARGETLLALLMGLAIALSRRQRKLRRARERIRAATREHRHRLLNALLAANQDCLALLDRQGRLLAMNAAGRELLELESTANVLGRSWLDAWPEQQRAQATLRLQAALTGSTQRFEGDCSTARGRPCRWDIQLLPVLGNDEEVHALLLSARDISPVALALRESHEVGQAYAELLARIDDAFLALDSDWRVVFANKEAEQTLHSGDEGLVGRGFWEVFPELNGSEFQMQCLESLDDAQSRRFEFFLARHAVWLSVAVYSSRQGVALLLRDVTEQVRASAQIERHRARLRLAQDIAGFGDWEYDVLQGRLELGEASCKLLGADPAEAVEHGQRVLLDAVEESARSEVLSHLLSRIASRRPIDIRFSSAPGRPAEHLRLRGQIMADEAGRPRHVVGTLHDISEAAQRLDEAVRERAFLRALIDALPQHICVVDEAGIIVNTNRAWDEFALGAGANPMQVGVGASYRDACAGAAHLPEVQAFLAGLDQVGRGHLARHRQRYCLETELDGRTQRRWYEAEIAPLQLEGRARLLLVSHEDISIHFEVLEQLEQSEQRFRELAECLPDTFFVHLPDQDRLSYVSPGLARLPGRLAQASLQHLSDLAGYLLGDDRTRWLELLASPQWYAAPGQISLSVDSCRGPATIDVHFSPVRESDGRILRVVGLIADSSDVHRQTERIRSAVLFDELTQLPNRLALQRALAQRIEAGRQAPLALLILNLDGMKTVNDSFGHPFGDALIAACARRLREIAPINSVLARIGGDEFAWLLPGCSERHQVAEFVETLSRSLREPFLIDGEEISIGASSGCALHPVDAVDPIELLRKADLALHAAKREGRGRHVTYGEDVGAPSASVLRIRADLDRALERDEFELVYQPKYGIEPLRLCGVEALLRWRRRGGQRVSPAEFIPLLEEDGGIVAVGAWALQVACQQVQRWRTAGASQLNVAVNVSARQMQDARIVTDVVAALTASGLEPEALELEITESALMRDPARVVHLTRELRGLGVRIALDDFGTRYSSLNYLRQFAPQVLKIDKSFVDDIDRDETAAAMARAIVQLGRSLDMQIVAEGVERRAQLERLREFGCDEVQGYLLMRPVSVEQLESLLLAGHLPKLD